MTFRTIPDSCVRHVWRDAQGVSIITTSELIESGPPTDMEYVRTEIQDPDRDALIETIAAALMWDEPDEAGDFPGKDGDGIDLHWQAAREDEAQDWIFKARQLVKPQLTPLQALAAQGGILHVVKGRCTCPDAGEVMGIKVGDTEWQVSDGPPGERGCSEDFGSLEKALAAFPGAAFIYHP